MKSFDSSLDISKESVLTTIRMVSGFFRGELCRSPSPTSDANRAWNMSERLAGSIYCIYSITEQKYNFNQLLFHSVSVFTPFNFSGIILSVKLMIKIDLKYFFWLHYFVIFWMSIDGYKWQTSAIVILTLIFTDFMSVTTAVCKYFAQSLVL